MSVLNPVQRTARGRAATALRDRILTGTLRPGTRLDLDELTEEFAISRTPVREALLQLSYEGLVVVSPRSRIVVVGITPEDAVDNFAILASLTGTAAQWAAERAAPEEIGHLRELADAIAHDPDVVSANWRFHRALNQAARSRRLLTHLTQAAAVVPVSYFSLFPEQMARSEAEHALLLDAVGAGDGGAARRIAEAHILDAGAALGDWLRQLAHAHGHGGPAPGAPGATARPPRSRR